MVTIINKEHFNGARKFAYELGGNSKKSFVKGLSTLNRLKRRYNCELVITPDFVKHSFGWFLKDKDNNINFNGGMILHGFEETLSIELTAPNYPHWSLHT